VAVESSQDCAYDASTIHDAEEVFADLVGRVCDVRVRLYQNVTPRQALICFNVRTDVIRWHPQSENSEKGTDAQDCVAKIKITSEVKE
jgi:hypothetical protein